MVNMNFKQLLKTNDISQADLQGISEKVHFYYDDYKNQGYRPTTELIKDWNGELKYKKLDSYQYSFIKSSSYQESKQKQHQVLLTR